MAQVNIDNIKAVYQLASSAERVDGFNWYSHAFQIAEELRDRYELPGILQVVGCLTALSPRNKWSRNVVDAEATINAFKIGGEEQALAVKCCTFGANKRKAVSILALKLASDTDVKSILSGPKLQEFYNCILGLDDVCIDGHAWCIHFGGRCSLKDVPKISKKSRKEIKDDYRAAAKDLGIEASALQAITWCAWRRIHGVG